MQGHSPYGIYAYTVVSDFESGDIPVEMALKKILDMVITSVQPDQLQACLWAWSRIVDGDNSGELENGKNTTQNEIVNVESPEVVTHGK